MRRHENILCFSFLLFITFNSLFCLADEGWKPFVSQEGRFSVLMPSPPSFKKTEHKSFVGTIDENTYQSRSNTETFSIEYSDLPKTALFLSGAETIFDETREGILNNLHGIQLQFSPTNFQKNSGKSLTFKIPAQKDEVEKIGKAKIYLVNQRIYVLIGIGPRSSPSDHIEQFLNSFRLL